jgi:hypothetical protein
MTNKNETLDLKDDWNRLSLRWLQMATDQSSVRDWQHRVCCAGERRVFTSDGYRMHVMQLPWLVDRCSGEDALVKQGKSIYKKDREVDVETFESSSPPIDNMIPHGDAATVTVNTRFLKEALEFPSDPLYVTLEVRPDRPLVVRAEYRSKRQHQYNCMAVIMPAHLIN